MTIDRKVKLWWLDTKSSEILDWYASIVHESHRLSTPTDDWFKCPTAPCILLQRAVREKKIPEPFEELDGAGSY